MSNSVSLMISGLIYAAVSMLHLMVFGRLDGSDYGYYYASAAMFDCVCAICICMSAACLDRDWHLLLGSSLNVGRLLGLNRFGPVHFVADSDGILLDRRKKD